MNEKIELPAWVQDNFTKITENEFISIDDRKSYSIEEVVDKYLKLWN